MKENTGGGGDFNSFFCICSHFTEETHKIWFSVRAQTENHWAELPREFLT